jgi:hypothetical protein
MFRIGHMPVDHLARCLAGVARGEPAETERVGRRLEPDPQHALAMIKNLVILQGGV